MHNKTYYGYNNSENNLNKKFFLNQKFIKNIYKAVYTGDVFAVGTFFYKNYPKIMVVQTT